jgi:hypothetical protein
MPGRIPHHAYRLQAKVASKLARIAPTYYSGRLRNPIFVTGFNKSGKTLITSILSHHQLLAVYPSEGNREIWFPEFFPWHESKIAVPPLWYDPELFMRAWLERRTCDSDRLMRAILGAYQFLVRSPYVANDSGMTVLAVPYLKKVFPDAHYIHVIRDGRVTSYVAAQNRYRDIRQHWRIYRKKGFLCDFPHILVRCAHYWNRVVDVIDEARASMCDRILEVRYEDFCAKPEKCLAEIADFLGLPATFRVPFNTGPLRNNNAELLDDIPSTYYEILTEMLSARLQRKKYLDNDELHK